MDLAHCWDSVVSLVISSYLVVQVTGYLVGRLLMFIFFLNGSALPSPRNRVKGMGNVIATARVCGRLRIRNFFTIPYSGFQGYS